MKKVLHRLRKLRKKIIHNLKWLVFRINQKRIDRIVARYGAEKNFFFVQIGANDGKSGDPLRKLILHYRWHGILVEPIQYIFEKLCENYCGTPGLTFENVAIFESCGKIPMYRVATTSQDELPWYERIGSLDKKHIEKHHSRIKGYMKSQNYVIEEYVDAITFPELILRHHIKKIDLLLIDVEGYDYEIIKMIPFETLKPRMIWYENKHLSRNDKHACRRLLVSKGYRIIKSKDTFAYK